MPPADQPKKKRKLGKADNTVTIGGKVLSLEAFLRPSAPKNNTTSQSYTTASASDTPSSIAPSSSATPEEQPGRHPAKHHNHHNKHQNSHPNSLPRNHQHNNHRKHPSEHDNTDNPELLRTRQRLPIWAYREQIQQALRHHDLLLVVGETGSGKSTQTPQFLYTEPWCHRQRVKVPAARTTHTTDAQSSTSSSNKSKKGKSIENNNNNNNKSRDASNGYDEVNVGGCIAVTQPRRVAATTLAHRVAEEVGTPLTTTSPPTQKQQRPTGKVGYSVRFDHQVPPGTRIKFLTEGMLLQELLHDPHLRQYSAVVVDEIHERSVDVDLLSGFLKKIQQSDLRGRGGIPLKVVVMSATADVERIQAFFGQDPDDGQDEQGDERERQDQIQERTPESQEHNAQNQNHAALSSRRHVVEVLHIKGRQFPVQVIHTPSPVPDLQEELVRTVFKIHLEEPLPGDILAFLTGQEEIETAVRLIEEYAGTLASDVPKIKAFPLFGQLSLEAQHAAFQPIGPPGAFARKIVLATNIAETSVTVPGVRFVIDCGKAKVKQFRARLGLESLLAKPISQSSAVQRTGRAGREAPGKCYRLYTHEGFQSLEARDLPEILRNDLLGALLTMKAYGIDDILNFPLMDMPDVDAMERALVHLHLLGALDRTGTLTEAGRKMSRFPIAAPYGAVLLAAAEPQFDCVLDVIDVIACITAGEDIFLPLPSEETREEVEEYRREVQRREGDILTYLTTLQMYIAENANRTEWCRRRRIHVRNMRQALKIRAQLRSLCLKQKLIPSADDIPPDPQPFWPCPPERADTILRCFLRGFVARTALLHPDGSYVMVHGKHVVAIHPASVLHGTGTKREAIMFLEHVFTQKNYAKKVSAIQANWVTEEMERA